MSGVPRLEMAETTLKAVRGAIRQLRRAKAKATTQPSSFKHFHNPFLDDQLQTVQNSPMAGLRGLAPEHRGMQWLLLPPRSASKAGLVLLNDPAEQPVSIAINPGNGRVSLRSVMATGAHENAWGYLTGKRCWWGVGLIERFQPVAEVRGTVVEDWLLTPEVAWAFLYLIDRRWARVYHWICTQDPQGPQLELELPADLAAASPTSHAHPLSRPDAAGRLVGPPKRVLEALQELDEQEISEDQLFRLGNEGVVLVGDVIVEAAGWD